MILIYVSHLEELGPEIEKKRKMKEEAKTPEEAEQRDRKIERLLLRKTVYKKQIDLHQKELQRIQKSDFKSKYEDKLSKVQSEAFAAPNIFKMQEVNIESVLDIKCDDNNEELDKKTSEIKLKMESLLINTNLEEINRHQTRITPCFTNKKLLFKVVRVLKPRE